MQEFLCHVYNLAGANKSRTITVDRWETVFGRLLVLALAVTISVVIPEASAG